MNTVNEHNRFTAVKSVTVNGTEKTLVVVGERSEIKSAGLDYKFVDRGKTIDFSGKVIRKKERVFRVVYAIQNDGDENNIDVAMKYINRRLNRNANVHMTMTTPNYFGARLCQNIVDTEADYIAEHIDEFIKKL